MRFILLAALLHLAAGDASTVEEDPEVLEALAQLEKLRTFGSGAGGSAGSGASTPPGPPPIDWSAPWERAQQGGQATPQPASEAPRAAGGQDATTVQAQAAAVSAKAWAVPAECRPAPVQDHAVVTLVTSNEGYPAGALAISAALEVHLSLIHISEPTRPY